jgi:RNA polymerase sigma-70 factor (ECF subfamily)
MGCRKFLGKMVSRMDDQQVHFLRLLDANSGRWRAIAMSYAAGDSEDLFQEILLQIWKSLPSFRGDSASSTWCYRVALNTALTWRRSEQTRHRRLPIVSDSADVAASRNNSKPDLSRVLQSMIALLSPTDRAILLLALDDVSYAEMAAITGGTEGALRVRVHRIKQRLAEMANTEIANTEAKFANPEIAKEDRHEF